MTEEFDDIYELEQDLKPPGRTPQEIMDEKFNDTYKRDWKLYLASIEWDTWCKPMDAKSIIEQVREREIKNHPFNQFF